MLYALCFTLIAIGLYGVFAKKNVVKVILSLMIVEYGINLLLVMFGYRMGGVAPIVDKAGDVAATIAASVDPLPQALVVASIVIGLGLLILMVALSIRLYERHGTFDITAMRRLKE